MRIWGKIWKDNRLVRDAVITDESDDTRTHKIFHALDELCLTFDLGKPIWLDARSGNLSGTAKPVFTRTALLKKLNLTTWKSRCWKNS